MSELREFTKGEPWETVERFDRSNLLGFSRCRVVRRTRCEHSTEGMELERAKTGQQWTEGRDWLCEVVRHGWVWRGLGRHEATEKIVESGLHPGAVLREILR